MDAAAIVEALTTQEGRANPFPLYERALELGPVSVIADGWYLVSSYAEVNRVLRDSRFGIAEPDDGSTEHDALAALNRSILRANPPEHGRMRSLISSVFTPRRVAALRPAIENAVDLLLDGLSGAGAAGAPFDFMEEFAFQLPVSVICELLGVPSSDRHRFRALAADLTVALELTADPAVLDPAGAAARELSRYFRELITESRADPGDNLVSALVAARDADDGRLSDVELVANLVVLLVAGFETTTNLLGNGLAILFERPGLAARLRSGDVPTAGFVEEVLRYDSPVQATMRVARADGLTVDGTPVPKGGQLLLLIGSANRDPDRYHDPASFDPIRPGSAPLAFGAGAHVCLGNSLARLEAGTAFPRLLDRFPDLAPAGTPTRRDRLVLRGYEILPVTITA
ncbi:MULTISPECIES: cytochrome P450 [Pseudofrankia]|uniref:cytochrome P450 n=1 Tax=Pseudofrankia TaxID=2994363 RepID=UPI0004899401|nr:cytochrome [Pseudofrankia sp. EUN1h]